MSSTLGIIERIKRALARKHELSYAPDDEQGFWSLLTSEPRVVVVCKQHPEWRKVGSIEEVGLEIDKHTGGKK